MKQMFRISSFIAVASLLVAQFAVQLVTAQPLAPPKFIAGTHYEVLPSPVKVAGDDKIEVMEIFWYGCGHCETFEPLLASWEKRAAEDVVLLRTPAVWQKSMRSHAALYYVAAALDAPHQLHTDLFALLVKNRALNDEKKFAEVFAKHGISEEKFGKLFKSFGITTKVNQGEKRLRKNYRAQGTPELIVNGKYRVGTRSAGGQAKMLEVVDFLIQQERKAALAAAA
ncbi:MAG: thiol:disulfide interchange protein DsbA/DsbL [Gammaproteobacteria bacterium]|nr:thiol:disulfide interchange protein DsbA/DsbL [Gammaproteobacteria bacterium]MBT8151789.1 thiol:disulfide interchange protein DsbA/DsbL [Gammaproteobacteria bacterium]NND39337.1 thiol:disulfide interchange protein DsbA/DsbL [Pseudomonadales bacterium]NNL11422.1 thiol:disulfide interchange protein DsbA/DsbL [Pseudomonadales bacterium]NNM12061.1 thiol:disulfide interchange protein DsbA/DsbL [Pseudomonadales bacterium]